jgi:hypothetical protein
MSLTPSGNQVSNQSRSYPITSSQAALHHTQLVSSFIDVDLHTIVYSYLSCSRLSSSRSMHSYMSSVSQLCLHSAFEFWYANIPSHVGMHGLQEVEWGSRLQGRSWSSFLGMISMNYPTCEVVECLKNSVRIPSGEKVVVSLFMLEWTVLKWSPIHVGVHRSIFGGCSGTCHLISCITVVASSPQSDTVLLCVSAASPAYLAYRPW